MAAVQFEKDTFIKFFAIADKLRQNSLYNSTSKKNADLFESMTVRQHKAIATVMLLTENHPVGINLKTLAENMNMTVPATSVLVESMVQSKIFVRITSKEDRRAVCIKLSDFGMSIVDSVRKKMHSHIQELGLEISEEEKETFVRIIDLFHLKLFPTV